MQTVRRIRWWLLSFLLLGAVGALAAGLSLRPRLLLERATRIGKIKPAPKRLILSDRKVMLFMETDRQRGDKQQGDTAEDIYLLDVPTGKTTFLPKLTAWYNKLTRPYNFEMNVSPDGKWVLLWQDTMAHIGGAVMSADGQQQWDIRASASAQYFPCWRSDSQRWLVFPYEQDRAKPSPVHIYSLTGANRTQPQRSSMETPVGWYPPVTLGMACAAEGRVITAPFHPKAHRFDSVTLYELPLEGSSAPHRAHVITLPPDCIMDANAVSPDAKRIAWLFHYKITPSAFTQRLARWMPGLSKSSQYFAGLWISRLDGKNMREIGRLKIKPPVGEETEVTDLAWQPDGKRLRFVYKDTLYTIAVD